MIHELLKLASGAGSAGFGDVELPKSHPETGQPFVRVVEFTRRRDRQEHHWAGPQVPSQTYYEDVDDGYPIGEPITMTDEEFAKAMAKYKLALAEFHRTGGLGFTYGPTRIQGTFECADGSSASGEYANGEWHWTEWRPK